MRNWRFSLGVVGSVTILCIAIWVLDWQALAQAFRRLDLADLVLAGAASIAAILAIALRWAVLAGAQAGVTRISDIGDGLVSQVFNLVTPAAVGSDIYRVAVSASNATGHVRAAGLVMFERVLGVAIFAMAFMLAFAAAVASGHTVTESHHIAAVVFGLALIALAVLVLARRLLYRLGRPLLPRPVLSIATAIVESVSALTAARTAAVVALTVLATMSWIIAIVVLANGAGLRLSIGNLTMISVVTEFSRLLPISVQGIGLREATFAALAHEAGGDATIAFAVCATAYLLHFFLVTVIGALAHLAAIGGRSGRRRD